MRGRLISWVALWLGAFAVNADWARAEPTLRAYHILDRGGDCPSAQAVADALSRLAPHAQEETGAEATAVRVDNHGEHYFVRRAPLWAAVLQSGAPV